MNLFFNFFFKNYFLFSDNLSKDKISSGYIQNDILKQNFWEEILRKNV